MIPTVSPSAVPPSSGKLLFHVIIEDRARQFSIDGPDGPNGVRLHYEMVKVARNQRRSLRDFDLRADSLDEALSEMEQYFPGYKFLRTWAAANSNSN
jgi:hypothetical protein